MCGSTAVPLTAKSKTVVLPSKLLDISSSFKEGPASFPCVAGILPMYPIN